MHHHFESCWYPPIYSRLLTMLFLPNDNSHRGVRGRNWGNTQGYVVIAIKSSLSLDIGMIVISGSADMIWEFWSSRLDCFMSKFSKDLVTYWLTFIKFDDILPPGSKTLSISPLSLRSWFIVWKWIFLFRHKMLFEFPKLMKKKLSVINKPVIVPPSSEIPISSWVFNHIK